MIYLPKSQPAPPCLETEKAKASGTYYCPGVLERLKEDFKNKCYICEDKELHSINIEHFKPHKGDKDLKFDWNNLFYCCVHCNSTKGDKSEYDTILNCTIETDEVDKKIQYHIDPFPREEAVLTAVEDSEKVHNTVKLLSEVYNGATQLNILESSNIRRKLLSEIRIFQDLLFEYDDVQYNEEEKQEFKNQIIRHLRSSSNFTAFKRWILRNHESLGREFSDYL